MGAYPADDSELRTPLDCWDADDLALGMENHPCVWSDGSREDYPAAGLDVPGSGVYLPAPEEAFWEALWRTVEKYGDSGLAILALQAF